MSFDALTFLCLFFFSTFSFSQINLIISSEKAEIFFETYNPKKQFRDSTEVKNGLGELILNLRSDAYLSASLDSLELTDSTAFAEIYVGRQFAKFNLKSGGIEKAALDAAGFRQKSFQGKPLDFSKVKKLQSAILNFYENSGYPFASVFLDSITFEKEKVSAALKVKKGKLVYFKDMEVRGDARVSDQYLINYLGIEDEQFYDRSKVLKIPARLRALPFLKEKESAKIDFALNRAIVQLNLQAKKASRFDFIIGVLPQNTEFDRLLITGNFVGEFQNQFGKGERIFADIRQLRPQTPEVDLAFNYPYIFDSSLGADFKFGLYKRDTSYIDVNFDAGVQYLLEGGNYFKGFFKTFNSNLLAVNQLQITSQKKLPERLDVSRSELGIEFFKQKLDYRFNPRKGWEAQLTTSAGLKTIKENALILDLSEPGIDFEALYDSLDLQTFQSRNLASFAVYLPTASNQTLKLGIQGTFIISPTPILQNEQKRIGGNRILRGFDEESIFATNFAVATAEYRLLTGQNSFLFAFADAAYVEDKTPDTNTTDLPYGFGAGVTFDTAAGIFGLSYALGSRLGNPLDLRAGKIHFGYLSLF